jgi:hypothetical protein
MFYPSHLGPVGRPTVKDSLPEIFITAVAFLVLLLRTGTTTSAVFVPPGVGLGVFMSHVTVSLPRTPHDLNVHFDLTGAPHRPFPILHIFAIMIGLEVSVFSHPVKVDTDVFKKRFKHDLRLGESSGTLDTIGAAVWHDSAGYAYWFIDFANLALVVLHGHRDSPFILSKNSIQ